VETDRKSFSNEPIFTFLQKKKTLRMPQGTRVIRDRASENVGEMHLFLEKKTPMGGTLSAAFENRRAQRKVKSPRLRRSDSAWEGLFRGFSFEASATRTLSQGGEKRR